MIEPTIEEILMALGDTDQAWREEIAALPEDFLDRLDEYAYAKEPK